MCYILKTFTTSITTFCWCDKRGRSVGSKVGSQPVPLGEVSHSRCGSWTSFQTWAYLETNSVGNRVWSKCIVSIIYQLQHQLRIKAKNNFDKDLFKSVNNSVFRTIIENIRKHKNINPATNEKAYSKGWWDERWEKIRVLMNKPVSLGQIILDLSKIVMYESMLPKYANIIRLCYMDIDSFVYDKKTGDFYKDIADDVESRFDTSGFSCSHPLPMGVNKKVIGLMKDELGGWVTEFVALRLKLYMYKIHSGSSGKNQSSDILQQSQNRPTGDRQIESRYGSPDSRRKFDKSKLFTKILCQLMTQAMDDTSVANWYNHQMLWTE